MEFKGRKILAIGIQESGKTEWAKNKIRTQFKHPIVWTEHPNDWEKEDCFIYKPETDNISKELEEFCSTIKRVNTNTDGRFIHFDVVVFDDVDATITNAQYPASLRDLNANHRHYDKLSMIFICRRPEQLNTNIVESCHYLVCFSVEGENTFNKLRALSKDFEEMVRQLKYKSYRCVIKPIGEQPYFENAVRIKK